jgi:hypothetical protein
VKRDKSDYTNSHFPILHIIGLPGAGKTTLAKRLSGRLDLPIFQIGEYRSKPQSSSAGEADAWVALFKDLSRRRWRNCIFETTGLNRMESFLRVALPLSQIITIKLDASRKVLDLRIGKKESGNREVNGCSVRITRISMSSCESSIRNSRGYLRTSGLIRLT